MIYEYFRVTGANDSVENYADLFTISLRNDDIQEFDSEWDGILLSMTKIPSDDILEEFYKLRIRESEKLKTALELYDLETHQKKAGPDYHRLKTMVKRSFEQNLRMMNFKARNGNCERNAVVKNQEQNSVYKEYLEIVGNGKPTGSVPKGTTAVSVTISISVKNRHSRILLRALLRGRMREVRREPEVPEARVPMVECLEPSQETQRSLQKFLEPNRKPKAIYTDNSLEFGKSCEDLSCNHCTSTPHRSETNGIAERAVRRVKEGSLQYCCNQVWIKNWWADSIECYTYLRNVTDLLSDGKTPYERRFGQPFKDRLFYLVHWLIIILLLQRTSQESINLERKSYLECSSDNALYAGGTWKGDLLVADIEELENAKEVIFPEEKGKFIFQPQMDEKKKLEEIKT